jgi:hypothetical protein
MFMSGMEETPVISAGIGLHRLKAARNAHIS